MRYFCTICGSECEKCEGDRYYSFSLRCRNGKCYRSKNLCYQKDENQDGIFTDVTSSNKMEGIILNDQIAFRGSALFKKLYKEYKLINQV